MIEASRKCLYLFNSDYVNETSGIFSVIERDPKGKGAAKFNSGNPCILIRSQKQSPQIWALKQRKCADGAFLTFDDQGSHLHLVELKSKLSLGDWAHALHQFEGMYLTAIAIMRLLEIQAAATVTCYLAAKEDAVTEAEAVTASPTLMKAPVGAVRTFGGLKVWLKDTVSLPFSTSANLVKGWGILLVMQILALCEFNRVANVGYSLTPHPPAAPVG